MVFLWLPTARVWQEIGKVTEPTREAAQEAALKLHDCPPDHERPALALVPLRYWQPVICAPPPPVEGHTWRAFVPSGTEAGLPDPSLGLGVEGESPLLDGSIPGAED